MMDVTERSTWERFFIFLDFHNIYFGHPIVTFEAILAKSDCEKVWLDLAKLCHFGKNLLHVYGCN